MLSHLTLALPQRYTAADLFVLLLVDMHMETRQEAVVACSVQMF